MIVRVAPACVLQMISEVDVNNDGSLDYEEYLKCMWDEGEEANKKAVDARHKLAVAAASKPTAAAAAASTTAPAAAAAHPPAAAAAAAAPTAAAAPAAAPVKK